MATKRLRHKQTKAAQMEMLRRLQERFGHNITEKAKVALGLK